jgi:hypothetical protein
MKGADRLNTTGLDAHSYKVYEEALAACEGAGNLPMVLMLKTRTTWGTMRMRMHGAYSIWHIAGGIGYRLFQ